jgi:hypothetical protein
VSPGRNLHGQSVYRIMDAMHGQGAGRKIAVYDYPDDVKSMLNKPSFSCTSIIELTTKLIEYRIIRYLDG